MSIFTDLYDRITGTGSFVRTLGDINWIERATERYFTMPLEKLDEESSKLKELAKEAGTRSKKIASIYNSLGAIEEAKINANLAGASALDSVQKKRLAYRDKKRKLLEAAAKKGRV